MITEDYVSFEIAKLLKEKGFDEGCSFVVNAISKGVMPVSWPTTNSDIEDEKASLIALPTLQMTMKWLREIHNIFIVIEPHTYDYINGKNSSYVFAIWEGDNYIEIYSYKNSGLRGISYSTYEEACEAAIKYCLENLI